MRSVKLRMPPVLELIRTTHSLPASPRTMNSSAKPALLWRKRLSASAWVRASPTRLEGSARRRYVRSVCRELVRSGIRPAALNFRGCSGESNRAPHFYHSGKTDDPAFVLSELRERYPTRRFGALGFSLGGNVLLKLMGERADGGLNLVDAAAVISVPYDLAAGCALLGRSRFGQVYSALFLRALQAKLKPKATQLAELLDLDAAMAARTIWEFDDRITAPLNGFASAAEYYDESSSARYLRGIRVPTLMLHAQDDPLLPRVSIPEDEVERNGFLQLELQRRGGHVGFLEGTPWRPSFWADEESVRFLAGRLLNDADRSQRGASEVASELQAAEQVTRSET